MFARCSRCGPPVTCPRRAGAASALTVWRDGTVRCARARRPIDPPSGRPWLAIPATHNFPTLPLGRPQNWNEMKTPRMPCDHRIGALAGLRRDPRRVGLRSRAGTTPGEVGDAWADEDGEHAGVVDEDGQALADGVAERGRGHPRAADPLARVARPAVEHAVGRPEFVAGKGPS